jgi:RNA polymerase sigma-70 factor (ECF subfamily)
VLRRACAEGVPRLPSPTPAEEAFHAHRSLLWGLCYRLTGSAADADDLVQETFLRALERPPPSGDATRAWLVRVATNLGIDALRRRRRRAARDWLPEPVATDGATPCDDFAADRRSAPDARYGLRESLSYAFLLALEALTPRQRAVLLLRDVLGHSPREAADLLAMSEGNVRVTHLRARRGMRAYDAAGAERSGAAAGSARALAELLRCLLAQDAAGVERLLADSVRAVTDAGGEFTALRGPMVGRRGVATLLLRVARRRAPGARIAPCSVNGLPALRIVYGDRRPRAAPRALLRCEVDREGRIREIHVVLASRKLGAAGFA